MIYYTSDTKGVVLAFGVFDGIHIGHQAIIKRVVERAKFLGIQSVIITFDPHPALWTSGSAPPMITTIEKKLEIIKSLGIDRVSIEDFNDDFSKLSPEEFVKNILIDKFNAREIVAGYDCAFGKDKAGDKSLLKELGKKYGYAVHIIEPYKFEGDIVSSTRVRMAISQGNIELANKLLGRYYSITGKVVHGKGLGRQLGYATANLVLENVVLPPYGVYAAKALIDNEMFNAMLYIGVQPTFKDNYFSIEVHLMDFEGTLYGKELEVFILEKIRDEKRFNSIEELVEQMKQDEISVKQIIAKI